MKFLIKIAISIILCAILQYFLPWWTIAIGTFVIAFIFDDKGLPSFMAGFLAVGLLWIGVSGYISFITDSVLTTRLNQLLPINSFVITGLVGGLVGGFGALTGSLVRKL
jgi:predicted membrane-bound spermidine synthase